MKFPVDRTFFRFRCISDNSIARYPFGKNEIALQMINKSLVDKDIVNTLIKTVLNFYILKFTALKKMKFDSFHVIHVTITFIGIIANNV